MHSVSMRLSLSISYSYNLNDLPFMPNPEPDPVPIWNGSFIWNEKFTVEFNYKMIKQMLSFYKEAIKQDMYCYHCLTSNSYK